MAVGAANETELVRIDPELRFQLQAVLERRTRIFELEHLGLLRFAEIEIALVPALEVGELIVGRNKRMRFTVAFDLRQFVERLPARAAFRVRAVDSVAGKRLDDREHAPVAEIAVVRQRQNFAAGFFFRRSHPFPEIARIIGAQRRITGQWFDQPRAVAVFAKDDVSMKVVAAGVRAPLETNESRKPAGLVRIVRCLDRFAPGAPVRWRTRQIHQLLREGTLGKRHDHFNGRFPALARLNHVIPPAPRRIAEYFRLPR